MSLPPIDFLHRLADLADKETMSRFRADLVADSKPKEGFGFDPVTDADREAERVMRDLISQKYPDHAIMGEEFGRLGSGLYEWVLDPIDGTRPYLLGLPVWGTLIGLLVDGRAQLGLMSQPLTGERFYADESGAWLRSPQSLHQLRASDCTRLADAKLHTNSPENVRNYPAIDFTLLESRVRMTRYGGECYAFAMVAGGRIDLALEYNLQPYDIAAIIPLIEKAGGVITTLSGGRPEAGGAVLASGNPKLHETALRVLMTG
ncbi:histidinol-phosphatase [Rhizobium sp. BK060]|uniref:histidinol-phosphatase n=1 Tax=Rhizobium sp. BK060 TaxID=2587096 RepID=UPI001621DA76|nr:histidinol-phosphatase [Rhizobium sp. BK060]MBB3395994.1 histidinol phosphatase-like enzyme (inositol monophosphatase family) [Rhizobium sp. BK060]